MQYPASLSPKSTLKKTQRQLSESGLLLKMMKTNEQIAAKKAEIEHYDGVLDRYWESNRTCRWLDQGRRHLEGLKEELRLLETE